MNKKEHILLHLIIIFCVFYVISFLPSMHIFWDERDIVSPATLWANGETLRHHLYPGFVFLVYGMFIKLFSWINIENDVLCRLLNLLFYIANGYLFFFIIRKNFKKELAFFGTVIFLLNPGIVYSGLMVKTESLHVFEILVLVLLSFELFKYPRYSLYYALSGCFCSFVMMTKFNIFALSLFLVAHYYTWPIKNDDKTWKSLIANKQMLVFMFALVFPFLFLFPDMLHFFYDFPKAYASAMIGNSGFGYLYARDSIFEFPKGMLFHTLIITLPATIGPFQYMMSLFGAVKSKIWSQKKYRALLVYLLLYFLYYTFSTLLRLEYFFTPLVPIFILMILLGLEKISNRKVRLYFGSLLVVISLAAPTVWIEKYTTIWNVLYKTNNLSNTSFLWGSFTSGDDFYRSLMNDINQKEVIVPKALYDDYCSVLQPDEMKTCDDLTVVFSGKSPHHTVDKIQIHVHLFGVFKIPTDDWIYLLKPIQHTDVLQ